MFSGATGRWSWRRRKPHLGKKNKVLNFILLAATRLNKPNHERPALGKAGNTSLVVRYHSLVYCMFVVVANMLEFRRFATSCPARLVNHLVGSACQALVPTQSQVAKTMGRSCMLVQYLAGQQPPEFQLHSNILKHWLTLYDSRLLAWVWVRAFRGLELRT